MEHVGILGGSFNPVHTGHVRMAVEVLERLELDRVELVPAAVPPHKSSEGMLPFELRCRLARLAVEGIDGLSVNGLEGERSGPSFTCDTLECYRNEPEPKKLFLIMGAGTFMELPQWRNWRELPQLTNMVAVSRGGRLDDVAGFVEETFPDAERRTDAVWRFPMGNDLHALDIPRLDVKASVLRSRWRARKRLTLLVPPAVERVLEDEEDLFEEHWGARVPR